MSRSSEVLAQIVNDSVSDLASSPDNSDGLDSSASTITLTSKKSASIVRRFVLKLFTEPSSEHEIGSGMRKALEYLYLGNRDHVPPFSPSTLKAYRHRANTIIATILRPNGVTREGVVDALEQWRAERWIHHVKRWVDEAEDIPRSIEIILGEGSLFHGSATKFIFDTFRIPHPDIKEGVIQPSYLEGLGHILLISGKNTHSEQVSHRYLIAFPDGKWLKKPPADNPELLNMRGYGSGKDLWLLVNGYGPIDLFSAFQARPVSTHLNSVTLFSNKDFQPPCHKVYLPASFAGEEVIPIIKGKEIERGNRHVYLYRKGSNELILRATVGYRDEKLVGQTDWAPQYRSWKNAGAKAKGFKDLRAYYEIERLFPPYLSQLLDVETVKGEGTRTQKIVHFGGKISIPQSYPHKNHKAYKTRSCKRCWAVATR